MHKWAILDIETTGINPGSDSIIDIGFLQFEGLKLVKRYSSLVRTETQLSHFIQKLTGITNQMVAKAPTFEACWDEIADLDDHVVIAHNSSFEASFLDEEFASRGLNIEFIDSIPFLGLLDPLKQKLGLEKLLGDYQVADSEVHRGLEDSEDLLRVLLISVALCRQNDIYWNFIKDKFETSFKDQWWFSDFIQLSNEELNDLSKVVDFNINASLEKISQNQKASIKEIDENSAEKMFDLKFNGENLQHIIRSKKLDEKFSSYTYRESQEKMSLKVGQSFANNIHSIIQAPTGTGKTFAYLLPAALYSLDKKEKVLISTGTKALQDQALEKDIPMIRKVLGLSESELKVAQLKGSQNHFCELVFRKENERQTDMFNPHKEEFDEMYSDAYLEAVFLMNSISHSRDELTREDLPYILKRKFPVLEEKEKKIAVDFRACISSKCPFVRNCSYIKGIQRAREADIIIGNHALMFRWPNSFDRPGYVVVDEAHRIEHEATSSFKKSLGTNDFKYIFEILQGGQLLGSLMYLFANIGLGNYQERLVQLKEKFESLAEVFDDHRENIHEVTESLFKKSPRYTSLYWNELPMVEKENSRDPVEISLYHKLESVLNILTSLLSEVHVFWEKVDVKSLNEENTLVAFGRVESQVNFLSDASTILDGLLNDKSEDRCCSMKFHEEQGYAFEVSPINVGKDIYDNLLHTSNSVVYTSATLSNVDGTTGKLGMEWWTGYSYLEGKRRFKSGFFLEPVFNYKEKSRVFLSTDCPAMYSQDYVKKVCQKIFPLIDKLNGRSLLLFSSRVRFEQAVELLLKEFEGKIPLFIQGMGRNVVDEFKTSEAGILIGMESFGEGIDLPGDILQFVYIDKIPDLSYDLVVDKRRKYFDRTFGNEFSDYFLATRARKLQQKLGRLLRTESDVGAALVTDARLERWKSRTKEQFLTQLKPYEVQLESMDHAIKEIENYLIK